MGCSPILTPSSEKRFWSTLRSRMDELLENRKSNLVPTQMNMGESDRAKRLKEDSLLLLRGFDSVANSLSQLTSNLDNALQGARDLAKSPTLSDIFRSNLEKAERKAELQEESEEKKGLKRKLDIWEDQEEDNSKKDNEQIPEEGKLKKAKRLAVSIATKAASVSRELKSIKADLCFMQERCSLLEEENKKLRDGFDKGMRPEEDDLVRLQLEALLAEKSRLATENANLARENQCLQQLVQYHQLTSQDLSASYEQAVRGMCLDFSSPPLPIPEDARADREEEEGSNTPRTGIFGFSLDEWNSEELIEGKSF